MRRVQKDYILKDLEKKVVILQGPRQVGKTWLAKDIAENFENSVYLNYDRLGDREIIIKESWLEKTDLLILDELHKMPGWKNYLKGVFDTRNSRLRIMVTGSARLDFFKNQGDSLAGRYFAHRLLPFSTREIELVNGIPEYSQLLMKRGGFPEPLLAESDSEAERWRRHYIDDVIRFDVLDFNKIQDFKAFQTLVNLLRYKVGSPISYQSISEDIHVAPNTVKKYIQILEAMYVIFIVTPFSNNISRSLRKEPKIYFFDTGMVLGGSGEVLENLAALHLLKHVFALNDYLGKNTKLHFLKTKDGQEVDFCVATNNSIDEIIEVKHKNHSISPSLKYFSDKYQLKAVQIVHELKREYQSNKISVVKTDSFFRGLFM